MPLVSTVWKEKGKIICEIKTIPEGQFYGAKLVEKKVFDNEEDAKKYQLEKFGFVMEDILNG